MRYNIEDYNTVPERLEMFEKDFPFRAIHTEVIHHDEERVIVQAKVWRDLNDRLPAATGIAEEKRSENYKQVNFSSALENCETSAVGRALAFLGYATKKIASREEMVGVDRFQREAEALNKAQAAKSAPYGNQNAPYGGEESPEETEEVRDLRNRFQAQVNKREISAAKLLAEAGITKPKDQISEIKALVERLESEAVSLSEELFASADDLDLEEN
jgi:hypothetical protein